MPVIPFIPAIIGAAGAIGGAAIATGGATNAAQTQATAAEQNAQLQYQAEQNALAFQQQQLGLSQANLQPYLNVGTGALNQLAGSMGVTPSTTNPLAAQTISNAQRIAGGGTAPATNLLGSPSAGPQIAANQPGAPFATGLPTATVQPPGTLGAQGRPINIPPRTAGTAPFANAGGPPLNTAGNLFSTALNEQWATPFNAPTAAEAAATPGEQFIREQGLNALQNSAAARGTLLSGGTLKGMEDYAGNLASTYYQQAYNNALQQYQQNYNIFQGNQSNQFNRLAALSGIGQTAGNQLASVGQNAANLASNTYLTGAAQQAQQANNAAAAMASGYATSGNIWGQTVSGLANNLAGLAALKGTQGYNPLDDPNIMG